MDGPAFRCSSGYHDFHSTAHDLLAIVAGAAQLTLGGQHGRSFSGNRGDVLVLQCTVVRRPSPAWRT